LQPPHGKALLATPSSPTGELMPDQQSGLDPIPNEHLARAAGAVALAAVAVIHVIDLSSTLSATPLIGFGHFVLIAAAPLGAALLLRARDTRLDTPCPATEHSRPAN
jgi:hypothetical protein